MRKLDNRGVAAFEFCLVAAVFFTVVFAIFDLGRYAITMQSLRTLAGAGARAMMIACYTPAVTTNTSPSGCTGSYMTDAQMRAAAPFLYPRSGLTPTLITTSGANALTVTASESFTPVTPIIWGTALDTPSASTSVPF